MSCEMFCCARRYGGAVRFGSSIKGGSRSSSCSCCGGTFIGAGAWVAGGIIGVAAALCLYDIWLKASGFKNWTARRSARPIRFVPEDRNLGRLLFDEVRRLIGHHHDERNRLGSAPFAATHDLSEGPRVAGTTVARFRPSSFTPRIAIDALGKPIDRDLSGLGAGFTSAGHAEMD